MKRNLLLLHTLMLIVASTFFTPTYGQDTGLADDNYPPFDKNVTFTESNLPIVIISTENVLNRNNRVMGHMIVINNPEENLPNYVDTLAHPNQTIECNLPIALKWRGNTSFGGDDKQTKKPISMKTLKQDATLVTDDKQKVSLLGMGKDNDWVLLAPWQDKSYVRDVLTMVLAQGGYTFAPKMRYCEVIFNGIYYGVYILSEQVSKGASRLNLWDYGKGKDAEGNTITFNDPTGDFHVEIDRPKISDGIEQFYRSQYHPTTSDGQVYEDKYVTYEYKYPEYEDFEALGITHEETVDKAIADMEDAFAASDYKERYADFIDINSFIDYEIAQEVSNNIDAYRLSTPMWKYSKTHAQISGGNDKWKFALWDFNIAYGHVFGHYFDPWREDWRYTANDIMWNDSQLIPFYWYKLMNDVAYIDKFNARYAQRRQNSYTDDRVEFICDSLKNLLDQGAVERDNLAWDNNFISWKDDISTVIDFTKSRIAWMDYEITQLAGSPDDLGDPDIIGVAEPLAIDSGYNMDVICEDYDNISGTISLSDYSGIDKAHNVFYTSAVREEAALCNNDGMFSSEHADYFVNVYENNALLMKPDFETDGMLTLSSPTKLKKLYLAGTGANGGNKVYVTIYYSDGSSTSPYLFYLPDWENTEGANVAVSELGRMSTSGVLSSYNHLNVFEIAISTDATKEVSSVGFRLKSGACASIFSLSGIAPTTDFTLAGTTFWKNGSWNTLCLPFDIKNIENTPLEGADVKTLESSDFYNNTLELKFTENLTSLEAGKPYIVKWENGNNVDDPTFNGVVLKEKETPIVTKDVDFIGKFTSFTLEQDDNTVLYFGDNNTLYFPITDITFNPYHAYFQLKNGITAGRKSGNRYIRAINIDFNDEPQGIHNVVAPSNQLIDYWYTLDGRCLSEKPIVPGIYLHKGCRVMIK